MNARRTVGSIVAAALFALVPMAQAQQAKPAQGEAKKADSTRTAVRSFTAKGVDISIAAILETQFCGALARQSVETVCPQELRMLITMRQADLGIGACDGAEDECLADIVKLSNADRVVTGEVARLAGSYIVSVSLLDAASGRVIARASETVKGEDKLLSVLDPLAKKLTSTK